MAEDVKAGVAGETEPQTPQVPKPQREPVTIEGEATDLTPPAEPVAHAEAVAEGEESHASSPEPEPLSEADAPSPETPAETAPSPVADTAAAADVPRTESRSLLPSAGIGLAGAVLGAVLATGAAWRFDPRAEPVQGLQTRQAALDAALNSQTGATKAIEARLAALESKPAAPGLKPDALDALDKRLTRLEASAPKPDALAALQNDVKAARAQADKALAAAQGAPAATGQPVQAADPRVDALAASAAALSDRLAKLEAAQAAPKAETRVAAAPPQPDASSLAIAALALEQRVRAGEPFPAEFAALARLGADAGALVRLKPYSDKGVPTLAALTAGFAALAPGLASGSTSDAGAGPLDKLMDHMRSLVRVRAVGEVAGDDPKALVSQISAALARGDVAGAMASYGKLPEAARGTSAAWAKDAGAIEDARAAARALREAAIQRLASTKN